MQRNPSQLSAREFDVLIIGAGAFGAAAARDAALRGLRTALIERSDFGGATSAECFKMVHGGIRYLQHADVPRLRASSHERSALLRIAPHLVQPLPIAIPTYGHGRRGRAFLAAGACAYDLLTIDRNNGISDRQRQIRRSRFLSRERLLDLFPHLRTADLSGAVVFEDGQMYNPARLVLAFVSAAVDAGATACNYVEATRFLWSGAAVCGVRARDRLSGEEFDVRARLTLNAAGPWADYLQNDPQRFGTWRRPPFSRDAYFIVDRAPTSEYGVAVQGLSRDKDAVLGRATRHLFAVPWRDKTLLGVWHRLFPEFPDAAQVQPDEVATWIGELNAVYPALQLTPDEVCFANCGLVPFGETATATELSFGKESRLIDHRAAHGVSGLVSLVGIRFTTARADAARALEMLLKQLPRAPRTAATARLPIAGGDIEDFAAFEAQALRTRPADVNPASMRALLRNHGSRYMQVLRMQRTAADAHAGACIADSATLLAEIRYAMEQEMAVKLEDVVMRRTELAAGSHPGRHALEAAAMTMGQHLRWSDSRIREELSATERTLSRHLARVTSAHLTPAADAVPAAHGAMLANSRASVVARVEARRM
ncbi:MAG TPA: FAD-dependent oxidoreductase [Steroidobacteraceae bacterium]|nr:FAD-dependent oxidoreductase [Steroidobacteraceae bacterium]